MYAKYTRIFRTPKETSKIHQILAVLERLLKHPNGCFYFIDKSGSPQDTVYLWGLIASNSRRFKRSFQITNKIPLFVSGIFLRQMENAAVAAFCRFNKFCYLFIISRHCAKNCVAFSIASMLTRSLMAWIRFWSSSVIKNGVKR